MKTIAELGISPAPWELWNVSGVFNKLVNLKDNYEVAKAQDGTEVHFCSLLKDKAANLANARLIAAAPDMYEALNGLLEIVCDDCKCKRCGTDGKCFGCPRVVSARKALEKAGG